MVGYLGVLAFLPLRRVSRLTGLRNDRVGGTGRVLTRRLARLIRNGRRTSGTRRTTETVFTGGAGASGVPSAALARTSFTSNRVKVLSLVGGYKLVPSGNRNEELVRRNNISISSRGMASICTGITGSSFRGNCIMVGGNGGICRGTVLN